MGTGVLRGDLGLTIDGQPVSDEIGRRMWVSLRLLLLGAIAALGSASRPAPTAPSGNTGVGPRPHDLFLRHPVDPGRRPGRPVQERWHLAEQRPRLHRGYQAAVHDRRDHAGPAMWSWEGIVTRRSPRASDAGPIRRHRLLRAISAQRHAGRAGERLPANGASQGPPRSHALVKHGLRTALIPMATFSPTSSRCYSSAPRSRKKYSAGTAWANISSTR